MAGVDVAVVADTCFLVDSGRGHAGALALQEKFLRDRELVLVPSIVVAEYLAGSRDPTRDLDDLQHATELQPFTVEDATAAGAIARKLIKAGAFPGWNDVFIAGFAANRGHLAVVTRNPKHFPKALGY